MDWLILTRFCSLANRPQRLIGVRTRIMTKDAPIRHMQATVLNSSGVISFDPILLFVRRGSLIVFPDALVFAQQLCAPLLSFLLSLEIREGFFLLTTRQFCRLQGSLDSNDFILGDRMISTIPAR